MEGDAEKKKESVSSRWPSAEPAHKHARAEVRVKQKKTAENKMYMPAIFITAGLVARPHIQFISPREGSGAWTCNYFLALSEAQTGY